MIVSNETILSVIERIKLSTGCQDVHVQMSFCGGIGFEWNIFTFETHDGKGCRMYTFKNFGQVVKWVEQLESKETDELRLVEAV